MPSSSSSRRWVRWLVGGVVVLLVLAVGAPFVYIHFIEGKAPAKLSVESVSTSTLAPGQTASPLAGTWNVAGGSTAGYRVKETLLNQSNTAVGRTTKITGSMTVAGTKVTKGAFSVDMTSVASVGNRFDSAFASRRDDQFQHRIMDTADFPTATFTLTSPIQLAPIPKNGVAKTYPATGKLTLHGTTKTVTIPITGRRTGNEIALSGITTVTFSDYGIDNPSGGPASVGDTGQLEFAVALSK